AAAARRRSLHIYVDDVGLFHGSAIPFFAVSLCENCWRVLRQTRCHAGSPSDQAVEIEIRAGATFSAVRVVEIVLPVRPRVALRLSGPELGEAEGVGQNERHEALR